MSSQTSQDTSRLNHHGTINGSRVLTVLWAEGKVQFCRSLMKRSINSSDNAQRIVEIGKSHVFSMEAE